MSELKIATGQVRLGMYISGLSCGWFRSPFWRHRFLVSDPAEIQTLHDAGITHVTIDLSKGIGPDRPALPADAKPSMPAELADTPRARAAPRTETDRARDTVARSKAAVMHLFGEARLGKAVEIEAVAPLVEEIAASMQRDRSAMLSVTRLKTKDEYTYLHSVAVCALMINLARQLGLDESEARQLGQAGLLHDIGKMGIPEAVLSKPGRLDDAEFALVREHPRQGHAMLAECKDVGPITLDVCLHHHEKIDGSGYPFGLTADQLSLHARMGAVCDVYDAVTSERPYKDGWSGNEALARMLEWEGHFDPDILQAFIASIGIQPRDGLVRLFSNRLGMVLDATAGDPAAPRVRVFYDVAEDAFLTPVEVATGQLAGGDPIIAAERWPHWFGEDWRALQTLVRQGAAPAALAGIRRRAGGLAR